jgi:hypothetical protein
VSSRLCFPEMRNKRQFGAAGGCDKFLLCVQLRAMSSIDGRDVASLALIWAEQSAASEYPREALCPAKRVAEEHPHSPMVLRREHRSPMERPGLSLFLPQADHDGLVRSKTLRFH